ncbi:MAG: gamma-glutamyltransferase [Planctomycetes bacterium]|nr:gamma-glutamyltransferase [Planctomycetota bacterium]
MKEVRAKNGLVSSDHPLSTQVGLNILQTGGSAVDAAVAATLTQFVINPADCGLGGYGGCMLLYDASSGRTLAVDFNGRAPAAAADDIFDLEPATLRSTVVSRELGVNVKNDEMTRGHKAIAVPGALAGLGVLHDKFGARPWAELVAPAIQFAGQGFLISASLANGVAGLAHSGRDYPVTIEMFMPQGRPPRPGATMRLPGLAKTLQRIADEGWRVFYEGDMAKRIAEYIQSKGGILTADDLKNYEAQICEPYTAAYHGRQVSTPPLPNGGASMLQMLNILSGFDLSQWDRESPDVIHRLIETFKFVWRDRIDHVGDPDFVDVDVEKLLSPDHAAVLQEQIQSGLAYGAPRQAGGPATCTAHVCVQDSVGNAVSLTTSHGMAYGSLVTIPGLSIVMNHGMCRFDPRPGRPNSIAPGKRLLNNMCPVIVQKDGRPVLLAGAIGGRYITAAVAQLLINLFDFGMSPGAALDVPRCYCEEAEPLVLEQRHIRARRDEQSPYDEERDRIGFRINWKERDSLFRELSAMGHSVEFSGAVGRTAHVIQVDEASGELLSGHDPRGFCAAAGY